MILSDRAGLLVRGVGDGRLLYRADHDGPVPMERSAFRSLLDGLPDARVAEFDDLESGLAELRRGKEFARCLRLFLILLDPDEPDEGLEEIADVADARLADDHVRDRVLDAMLVAPLPKEARLRRLKSFARDRANLLALAERVMTLQFSAQTVARMLKQFSAARHETLSEAEAFASRSCEAGLTQRLTRANDADLTKAASAAGMAAAPGEEVAAMIAAFDNAAEEAERRESLRQAERAAAAARFEAARVRMGFSGRIDRDMSKPIAIPAGVTATFNADRILTVAGPLGKLSLAIADGLDLQVADNTVTVAPEDASPRTRAFWGMQRMLVRNLMVGVTDGFTKKLLITGAGYRASAEGRRLRLNVGTSSTIDVEMPEGISVRTPDANTVEINGSDQEQVSRLAAVIRRWRKPQAYLGKGVAVRSGGLIYRRSSKGKKPKKA